MHVRRQFYTHENPPHPGEIIRELSIEPLELTVTQATAGLGVTRKTLSLLLNGHAGISAEMAVRLSIAFGRTPESWLQLQNQYDLVQIRQEVGRIATFPLFCYNLRRRNHGLHRSMSIA
jgi:addiction module HigA family antidote